MVAVTVTTDLSAGLIDDASSSTSFVEPTGSGSISGDDYADFKSIQDEADVFIQGVASTSAAYTTNAAQRGCAVTDNAAGLTIPTDGAILVWQWWISPSALSAYAVGGMFVAIGSAQSALEIFPVSGNNIDPAPLGGWYCYAVDPRAATPYETVGTPDSTTFQWIGGGVAAPKQSRGLTHYAIDAIRYGRCTSVISGGDGGDADAEFIDLSNALQNAADGGGLISYGIFDNTAGAFYMQGLLQMGITSTNICVFTDSNKVINIRNTPAVGANFNRWEIQHASSVITLIGCSFANIGVGNIVAATASLGDLVVVDSAATVVMTSCSFSDWGTFAWGSGTTLTSVAFRRCGQITENSATLVDCIFDSPLLAADTAGLITDDLGNSTGAIFTRGALGHAIELTSLGVGSMNWNNELITGVGEYKVGVASVGTTPVTPTAAGDEAIWVNVGSGTLTINIAGGATIPSIRSTGASIIIVSSFSLTLTDIASGIMVTIVNSSTRAELFNTISTGVDIIYPHTGSGTIDILLMANTIDPDLSNQYDLPLTAADSSIKFQTLSDLNYSA